MSYTLAARFSNGYAPLTSASGAGQGSVIRTNRYEPKTTTRRASSELAAVCERSDQNSGFVEKPSCGNGLGIVSHDQPPDAPKSANVTKRHPAGAINLLVKRQALSSVMPNVLARRGNWNADVAQSDRPDRALVPDCVCQAPVPTPVDCDL
jgi:hypothetical protein